MIWYILLGIVSTVAAFAIVIAVMLWWWKITLEGVDFYDR